MKFATKYDYKPVRMGFEDEAVMTKQSFRDECDINNLMKRYQAGLPIDHESLKTPQYGDFSTVDDYQSAVLGVAAATESFDALPAPVRKRFRNDPGELLEFMGDPANEDEARELGLIPGKYETVPTATVTEEKEGVVNTPEVTP